MDEVKDLGRERVYEMYGVRDKHGEIVRDVRGQPQIPALKPLLALIKRRRADIDQNDANAAKEQLSSVEYDNLVSYSKSGTRLRGTHVPTIAKKYRKRQGRPRPWDIDAKDVVEDS